VTTTPPRWTPRSPQRAALTGATDAYDLPVTDPTRPMTPAAHTPSTEPGSARATTVSVRLSGELLDRFERWAADHRWSRGRAATVAIERVLEADDS